MKIAMKLIVNIITVETTFAIQFLNCSKRSSSPTREVPHITLCLFDNFEPSELFKRQLLTVCFKPESSFQYIKLSISNASNLHYDEVAKVEAKSNVWNEVTTTIDKFSSNNIDNYLFEVSDLNGCAYRGEPLPWKSKNGKKLLVTFYGDWEGLREFTTENETESTNCNHAPLILTTTATSSIERESDVTTEVIVDDSSDDDNEGIASHYVLFLVGLALLVMCLICTAIVVPHYRKTRLAKEQAKQHRQSSIPILQLPKDFQRNRFSYFNVMTSDTLVQRDMSNYNDNADREDHEDPDVTYNTVDFEVVSNQEGKSVKEVIIFPKLFKKYPTAKSLEERKDGGLCSPSGVAPDITYQLK